MRWWVGLGLLAASFVGCLDAGTDGPQVAGGDSVPFALPPGCDAARPAVAHRSDGRVAPEVPGPVPIPCASYTGADGGEPTIGIHPRTGSVYYFPAWGPGDLGSGVMRSKDEGASWARLDPALAGVRTHPLSLDPYLYVDPSTGRVFADDLLTVNCSVLSWSDDDGASWSHGLAGCLEFDHQTIFAGPPRLGVTLGYPNVVYRCAINTVAVSHASTTSTCQKSLDGGATWLPPGEPAFGPEPTRTGIFGVPGWCDGAHGHGFVGPDGTVYLPKGNCGVPMLAISKDEGLTWTRVKVSDLGMAVTPGWSWDHEAGVGADAAGNVYYFWVDNQRIPRLSASRDGGRTWGPGLNVSAPGLREANLPELIVGGAGRVALVYMGSTDSPGGPFPTSPACLPDARRCLLEDPESKDYSRTTWNGYMSLSGNALEPDPVFLTATVNPPEDPLVRGRCGPVRCQEVYDFIDVRLGPDGTPWAAFVDGCVGGCASGAALEDNAAAGLVGRLWGGPGLLDR